MKIEYVTGNAGKFREAQLILSHWELEQVSVDIPELQGDQKTIVQAKARKAVEILQRPLIVEDVGLYCNALKGLPGPYVKDFLTHLGEEGLADLIHRYEDHRCTFICTAAYIKPDIDPILFDGQLSGKIVKPKGTLRHGHVSWNTIFQADGFDKTFAEMSLDELARLSGRSQALNKLREYLETHESF